MILSAHSSPTGDIFNLRVLKRELGLENLLNYLWSDVILLVISKSESQLMWEKYHSLVHIKLCIPHIIRGKMLALAHKGKMMKENLG